MCQGADQQVLLHLPVPLLAATGLTAGGGVVTLLLGAGTAVSLLGSALIAVLLVVGRVRDGAKGPMPLRLTVPMPTAQGDLSVLPLLAWQFDGVLLALAAGAGVMAGAGLGAVGALTAGAAGLVVLAIGAVTRLRDLRA